MSAGRAGVPVAQDDRGRRHPAPERRPGRRRPRFSSRPGPRLQQAATAGIPSDRTAPLEQRDPERPRQALPGQRAPGPPRSSSSRTPTELKAMTVGPDGGSTTSRPRRLVGAIRSCRLNTKHDRTYEIIKTGRPGRQRQQRASAAAAARHRGARRWTCSSSTTTALSGAGASPSTTRTAAGRSRTGAWAATPSGATTCGDIGTPSHDSADGLQPVRARPGAWTRSCATQPTLDGNRFDAHRRLPRDARTRASRTIVRLYIDGNLYTLTHDNVVQHIAGRRCRPGARHTARRWRPAARSHATASSTARGQAAALRLRRECGAHPGLPQDRRQPTSTSGRRRGSQPSMKDMRGMYVSQSPAKKAQNPKPAQVDVGRRRRASSASAAHAGGRPDAPQRRAPGPVRRGTRRPDAQGRQGARPKRLGIGTC